MTTNDYVFLLSIVAAIVYGPELGWCGGMVMVTIVGIGTGNISLD